VSESYSFFGSYTGAAVTGNRKPTANRSKSREHGAANSRRVAEYVVETSTKDVRRALSSRMGSSAVGKGSVEDVDDAEAQ
jgi:hypothetical protein